MAESLASIFVEISAKADDLTRVAARAQRDLQAVEAQAEALGATGAFDAAAAKAKALERTLAVMARRSPEAMGAVQDEVRKIAAEIDQARQTAETAKVMRTLGGTMDTIGLQAGLLGRNYNAAAARADALKKAIIDLNKNGLNKQSKELKDLTAQFKQATREAKRHERVQRLLNSSMRSLKTAGKAVAATITGLAGAAVGLGVKAVQISGQIEVMRVSWQGLTGSAELAEETLLRLKAFQRQTPFAFPEIESAAKQLVNYGFEIERVEELLKGMAAAAIRGGTGAAGLQGIATALGQMKSMGKVASQEINQLINAGVAAWPLMAEAMDLSVQELRDLMELAAKGKASVPAERVIWGLVAEMSKGADEMFAAYETTIPGLAAKLADSFSGPMGLMAEFGKQAAKEWKLADTIRGITVAVERWTKVLQERGLKQAWAELAPPGLRQFGDTVMRIANGIAHLFNVLANHGLKGVWEQIVPDWVPGVATAIAVAIAGKAAFSIAASIGELVGALGATSGAGGIVAILGGLALWKWVAIAIAAAAAIYLIVKAVKALTKERKKHDSLPPFGSGMALLSWETGGKRAVQAARQTRDEVRDMYRTMAAGVTDSSRRAADALGVDFARASDGMLNAMNLAQDAMPELASPQWDVEGLTKQIDETVSSLERMRAALTPDDFGALALGAQSAQKRLAEWLETLKDVEGVDHLRQNLVDLAAGMELLQTAAESGLDPETVQQALTLVQRLTEQLQTTLRDPTSWQAASEEAAALAATLRNETATMLADIQADIAAADMTEALSGLSDAVDIGTRAAVQAARLGIGDLRLVLRDGVGTGMAAASEAARGGLDRFGMQLQTGLGTSVQLWSGWRADTVGIVDQLVGDLTDQGLRLRQDFPAQIGGTADAISSIMDVLREDVTGTNATMFAAMMGDAEEFAQWAYLGSFWPDYQEAAEKWTTKTRDQSVTATRQMFQSMVRDSQTWDNQVKVILDDFDALALGAQSAQKRLAEWLETLKDVEGVDHLRQNLIDLADGMEMLQVAAESGAGIETVQKAMALVQRQTELLQTTLADPSSWQAASTEAEALASTLREDVAGILADIEAGMSAADVSEAMSEAMGGVADAVELGMGLAVRFAVQGMGDLRQQMRDGAVVIPDDVATAIEGLPARWRVPLQTMSGLSVQLFGDMGADLTSIMRRLGADLSKYGYKLHDGLLPPIDAATEGMVRSFQAAGDAIVFGSIVPDMVTGVVGWVKRLVSDSIPQAKAWAVAMMDSAKLGEGALTGAGKTATDSWAKFGKSLKSTRQQLIDAAPPIIQLGYHTAELSRLLKEAKRDNEAIDRTARQLEQSAYAVARATISWLDEMRAAQGQAASLQQAVRALTEAGFGAQSSAIATVNAEMVRMADSSMALRKYILQVISALQQEVLAHYAVAAARSLATGNLAGFAAAIGYGTAATVAFEGLKTAVVKAIPDKPIDKAAEALSRLAEELRTIEALEKARGDAYDALVAQARAYERALDDLARTGASAATIQEVAGKLRVIEAEIDLRKAVPQAAAGAYVPRTPGGRLFNVGEGGEDELILPLSGARRLFGGDSSGDVTININYPQLSHESQIDELGEKIVSRLRRAGVRV